MPKNKNVVKPAAEVLIRITQAQYEKFSKLKVNAKSKNTDIMERLLKEREEFLIKIELLQVQVSELEEANTRLLKNQRALLKDIDVFREYIINVGGNPDEYLKVKLKEEVRSDAINH